MASSVIKCHNIIKEGAYDIMQVDTIDGAIDFIFINSRNTNSKIRLRINDAYIVFQKTTDGGSTWTNTWIK